MSSPPLRALALRPRPALSALLFALALAACSSTRAGGEAPKVEPYDPSWEQSGAPEPIGKLLAGVDMTLRAWTKLVLSAQTEEERRQARGLELDLMRRVRPRLTELITELESGPPANRIPAAAALGFTHAPEAQSPLLAALEDSNQDVVNNALIGLAVLQRADTPLVTLEALLVNHTDAFVRSNSAWALRSLIEAGADGTSTVAPARLALADPEPFVRAQAALLLGTQHDAESVESIGELARESTPFVVLAATEALVRIGTADPHAKGAAARELVRAFEKSEGTLRGAVQRALIRLSGENHGTKVEEWAEWARKLP